MLELTKGRHRLTLLPETGGAIGQWQVDGHDVFLPVQTAELTAQRGVAVGAYPLVPYVNRVAHGQFSFAGHEYHMSPNMEGCPHPIHGNAWENEWTVLHKSDSHAILAFDHQPQNGDGVNDLHWPFAYRAVLSYALRGEMLEVALVVENRDTVEQPVGFGFHPFLASGQEASLSFDARDVWITDGQGLPVEAQPCDGEWSFQTPKPIYERGLDNGFTGFGGAAELRQAGPVGGIRVEADAIFDHLTVFTRENGSFVAIEPVTSMTDALNRPDIADRGVHVLKPGQRLGGNIRFTVLPSNA
ncbi:aldose 1-epimerase [Saccharibacter floricola]|uniref:Aldose 1-epimerase n=1 Tax=Saccharibacter floricola DSM 15669 TaxID=1123227 RepID=A0ABQ0NYP0_9PROT|nr:aldose 1-epimerase [Saccharibacter floricola]GBQ06734.1 aldose 1-epimerase [Saccharibacter floricola DSM 15669]